MPGKVQRQDRPAWGQGHVTSLHPQDLGPTLMRGPAILVLLRTECPFCQEFRPTLALTAGLIRDTPLPNATDIAVIAVTVDGMLPHQMHNLLTLAGYPSGPSPTVPAILYTKPNHPAKLFLNSEPLLRTPRRIMEHAALYYDDDTLRTRQDLYRPAALAPLASLIRSTLDNKASTLFVDYDMCPPNPRTMARRWHKATDPAPVAALGLALRAKNVDVIDVAARGLWMVPVPQLCMDGSAAPLLQEYARIPILQDMPQHWQKHLYE